MPQIFATIQPQLKLSTQAIATVDHTLQILQTKPTTADTPAMLLGKVQSGKTRTYVGVIAKAFDAGFDIAVILTKGTVALARQTHRRMQREFQACLTGPNRVGIYDVMEVPQGLTGYDLRAKMLLVCKKQHDNLAALKELMTQTYPALAQRRVLLIDDEADFASIGFQGRVDDLELRKIASQIDGLRTCLAGGGAFLQVTATPYALYLQPGQVQLVGGKARPMRPDLTVVVEPEPGYIGGQFFFEDADQEPPETPRQQLANRVFCEVPHAEFEVLRSPDRRRLKLEEVLESSGVEHLRQAVFTFIVGGCIRHLQQRQSEEQETHFSFIVHTEVGKASHSHQEQVVEALIDALLQVAGADPAQLLPNIRAAYDNLAPSVSALGAMPKFDAVFEEFKRSVDAISVNKVNSERQIQTLIDDATGELRRRTPFNIFIGGQILDRGITVGGLIGFFYGRRPNRFQADTVLQHARIYGYRPEADLAVTRFHTSKGLFRVMKDIHEIDEALREALRKAEGKVVFLVRDELGQVIPCAPSKVKASDIRTIRPHSRHLPVGFTTRSKTANASLLSKLDKALLAHFGAEDSKAAKTLPLETVLGWLDLIAQQFEGEWEEGYGWNWDEFKALVGYLNTLDPSHGTIPCVVRRDREVVRVRVNGRLTDQPDSSQREGKLARAAARTGPALILLRQNGKKDDGWSDCPFWWPVLITPEDMDAVIYSSSQE